MQEPTLLQQIVAQVAPVLVTLIATVITGVATWLASTIQKKWGGERSLTALNKLSHLVEVAVLAVEQSLNSDLRKRAEDGVLSMADAIEAKAQAIAYVKSNLSEHGIKDMLAALGFKDEEQLNLIISTHIEAAVARAKTSLGRKIEATIETKEEPPKSVTAVAAADTLRREGSTT